MLQNLDEFGCINLHIGESFEKTLLLTDFLFRWKLPFLPDRFFRGLLRLRPKTPRWAGQVGMQLKIQLDSSGQIIAASHVSLGPQFWWCLGREMGPLISGKSRLLQFKVGEIL